MRQRQSHHRRRPAFAGLLAAVAFVALATPAAAQIPQPQEGESSGAFGLAAEGLVVANSPAVSCGEGEQDSQSSASASVPDLVSANVLQAECDDHASSASVANATIGSGPNAIRLGLVESECNDGVASSSVVNLGTTDFPTDDQVITGPTTLSIPGVLTVFLNETTTSGAATVQNAVRVVVGDVNDPTEEIILAQARCTPPGVVIPEVPLAVILPLSAVALFGAAFLVQRRRSAGATTVA